MYPYYQKTYMPKGAKRNPETKNIKAQQNDMENSGMYDALIGVVMRFLSV